MTKKSPPKKTIKEEVVSQPVTTEQDSQFNIVPVDETPPPDTSAVSQETTLAPESTPQTDTHLEESLQATTENNVEPKTDIPPVAEPQPVKPENPLTIATLQEEIDQLSSLINIQSQQIADLLNRPVLKRKPVASNGKVQIKDKTTGRIFPSKNNAYQTLLKEHALDDLVKKGVFGDVPNKQSYGWYALNRNFPNRFEEIKSPEITSASTGQHEEVNNQ